MERARARIHKVRALGWSPRHSLREGLEKTIDWYRAELQRESSSFEG